jgi:poly(A) polymerase
VDFVGGQADLRAKLVRAIGDPAARFAEDHLRLLRAVRFAARLGFAIEPATGGALRAEASQLKRITPERIAEELRMMLTPATRDAAWIMLWQYGLAVEVFRHVAGGGQEMVPAERSIFLNLAPKQAVGFSLALAAAVICYRRAKEIDADVRQYFEPADVKRTVRQLRQGLRLSNIELDQVEGTLAGLAPILTDTPPTLAMRKRFLAMQTSSMSLELMRAMARAGVHAERIAGLLTQLEPLVGTEVAPAPLLTGDDLTQMGYQPGPLFKRVLYAVYDEQLEGKVATTDNARDAARKLASS